MQRLIDFVSMAVMILIMLLAIKACYAMFDLGDTNSLCGTLHSWDAYTQCCKLLLGGQ